MRSGLMILAAAATLGTAAINAAPASARHWHNSYHSGWRAHEHRSHWGTYQHDRRENAGNRRARRWYWHNHHRYYGYNGLSGQVFYG